MKYQKTLLLVITLLASMMVTQAKAGCQTAGAIDGTCFQTTLADTNYNGDKTVYSQSCWSAGALSGMCLDRAKPDSLTSMEQEQPKKICYTTGALSGMCI